MTFIAITIIMIVGVSIIMVIIMIGFFLRIIITKNKI